MLILNLVRFLRSDANFEGREKTLSSFVAAIALFQYCTELIHSLDQQVVARIREIDLSCYSLILPVLQEVADKCIPGKKLVNNRGWRGIYRWDGKEYLCLFSSKPTFKSF